MAKALVINIIGGPDSGKSTNAALVFGKLKLQGINAELITEYAKSRVWEEAARTLTDQLYVTAKQNRMQRRCEDKVEVMVTDSPLIMGFYYGSEQPEWYKTMLEGLVNTYNNIYVFLKRSNERAYNPVGRLQDESNAKSIDIAFKQILDEKNIPYVEILSQTDEKAADEIVDYYLSLKNK